MVRRWLLGSIAAALLVQPSAAPWAGDKRLTAADLWAIQNVTDPVVSPDGRTVLFTLSPYDAAQNKRQPDLWLVPVVGGTPRRLTEATGAEASPSFSPDGTRLVFSAKREGDEQNQLWVLPLAGGEAQRVTRLPVDASQPRWLPDGKRVVFVATVIGASGTPEETKRLLAERKSAKVSALVSENRLVRAWDRWKVQDEYQHLFLLDLEQGSITDLIPGSNRLFSLQDDSATFDISPDGKYLIYEANNTEPPYRSLNSDLFEVAIEAGTQRCLTCDQPGDETDPRYSPDGRSILFTRTGRNDGWPAPAALALYDRATGAVQVLTERFDATPTQAAFSTDGRSIYFVAEVRARANLYALAIPGQTAPLVGKRGKSRGGSAAMQAGIAEPDAPQLIVPGGNVAAFDVSSRGEIVFAYNSLTQPTELEVVQPDGSGRRALTTTNVEHMAQFELGTPREYVFPGADGEPVQMWVIEPPGFDRDQQYPLVHLIHGGPIGTFGDNWFVRWNAQVFAAPGHVVAMVNFHGSSSFGQRFIESILGAPADKPFEDLMAATDFLLAQGYVDPQRMAAGGGSYGGYLTNWIAGKTDRFRALFSHAGPYNLLAQFGSDATWGRHFSYGGSPFDRIERIERQSPNRHSATIETPMLILHGERDYRVPYTQALELHGTLAAKGIPSRLVVYPDENHWILKGANSQHWYGEVLAWLSRWLARPTATSAP